MYELNGKPISLEQLQSMADENGVKLEDLISSFKMQGLVEKTNGSQTEDATAEPNVTASKPVDFLSESKSYKPFNPLDVSGDLSLAVDPTGGVGAAVEMAKSVVTDEEFNQVQINKKQKENETLAQDKADAIADGPLLFLDFSQELGGVLPGVEMTKKPEVRPTIDGQARSAEGLPFVSEELDGYWEYTERRSGSQREYINSLWQSKYQNDLEAASNDKSKLNEKVKEISANYLDLDVDKEISDLNKKIKTLADGPVKDELIKQRDTKFKSKDYVPLLDEEGGTKGFIQEEYEEQAQVDADDFELDELEQSRLNLYYELVELGSLGAQFDGKRPVKDERIAPYIGKSIIGIKGAQSAVEKVGGAVRELFGAEDTYYDDVKLLEFIYDNDKLPANLTKLPGESQIAQRFNETLGKFKVANRAIEIKANLAALEEESYSLEGLDNLSKGLFKQTASLTEGNDETVQIFSDWFSEATGTTFDKNEVFRPGSSETRAIYETGRNIATDLTPLVLSIYATKKLPVGITTKYAKAGKGMIEQTSKAVTFEKRMAVTKNAIQKYALRGNKSKAYEKGVKVGLGAADEIVKLGVADVVGGGLFNSEGFVFNDQTGDVNLIFPGALGAGNVMAQGILNKVMTTKIPILTPIIANANRSKTLNAFMGANVSAGVGTGTLVFAERVDEYYRELINDRKFFEAKQLEEKDPVHHLVENYIGMLMIGGPRTLAKFGKSMQRDVLRLSNKLPGTDKAGRLLGLKHSAEPKDIDGAVENKINEVKSNKNLNKDQKEQQTSEIRKAGNKLQYLHEYNTAIETAKSHGNYMQFLSNQSVLLNKIKQGADLKAKEKEQLANLKEYEFDYIKAELGVRKNSVEGQLFDLRKKNFENIVNALNENNIRPGSSQRENIIDLMDQYLKVKDRKRNLEGTVNKKPELEGLVKEKINKINEQLKEITDKIDVETKSFESVFDTMIKGEVDMVRAAASEMGIKGFNVLNGSGFARFLMSTGRYTPEAAIAEAMKSSGVYDPVRDQIYLNMTRIKETRSLGDPLHELGHAILRKSLKGPDGKISSEGIKVIDQFRNSLTAQEQQIINERVKRNYNPDGTRNKNEYYEEYLMAWSDAVKNREITYNATTGQKISDVLYPVLSKAGLGANFAKTDINGENMFLFMQALQRSSLKKGLRKDIIEFGKKAREGDVKGEMLQSKNITKEQAEKVATDLNKINEIKKTVDVFAEMKGLNALELLESDPIYQRASQRIKDNISETTGRLTTTLTKKLFDPIPEDFTRPLGDTKDLARQNFQESLKSELEQMVIKEYNGKQELEKFIVNRGFLRAQSLAKRLGVIQEVAEGAGKEKQIADKPGMVKQGNELLLNMAEGAGPRVREATQKVYREIAESVETQKLAGKPEVEIVPGSYKQVSPKYLSELIESFVVGKRVEVKGQEVIGDKAMADRIVKQIETKQQLNNNEIAILKKSIGDNWLMFDAALPQGFTITGEATMGRTGGLKPYYNEMTQRATQETFGIAAAPSGRKPFVRIKGMNKETFMQPLEAITKGSESGPLKSMLVEYVRAFENQAMRSKLDPLGEAFKHLADGRSPYLFSVNEKTGMSVADLMQRGVAIGSIRLQTKGLIEAFGKANYKKTAREKHPAIVDLVETLMLNRNETLTVGGSYQKSIKTDKFTPNEIKNQLTEGGIYRGKKLNDATTRKKYVKAAFNMGLKMHPAIESSWIEASLALKDGYKGTVKVTDYATQRAALRNRSFTPAELQKMEADMKKLGIDVENLVNATPMEMKGFVKQTLESIGRETSLQAKEQILANAKVRIENINKANHDMLKYMNDLYQKEYAKEGIDNTFVLLNGALQTNIVSGKRAMSTFEYVYLREGKQMGLAKPSMFLPKTTKLPKRPNPKYNEQLQEYYKSWEQCAEYKERYNVRLKETKDKAEARELAISDLQWKNEHLGASATTNAETSSYIYSGGKSITLDNINNGHRTLWAPKYIADKVLDAKIKVGDKMIDNKVSLEGELRILKFGQGKLFGPDRKVVHFTGESASTYIASKNRVAEIINETLLAEQTSIVEVAKPSKILSFSKDSKEIKENIKIYDKAIKLGRMPNKKSRGMSTFDFDDTLATIKSGIRYEMPNPSGKPAPQRKAILLMGSAGAGKTTVIEQLGLRKQGFKYINQDVALDWLSKNNGLPKDMNNFTRQQTEKWRDLQYEAASAAKDKALKLRGEGDGVVIDGTGGDIRAISRKFKDAGYDVQVVHVNSSLETALARNRSRTERRLTDTTVKNSYEKVQQSIKGTKELVDFFPKSVREFVEVNTDNLKQGEPLPAEFVKKINDFTSGYIKGRINAEQFAAEGAKLLEQGAKYDFSEFNKVVEGAPGPLLGKAIERAKKFGNENMFVLTARPAESAGPIREFLKSQGLDIPLENITGLGNSTGEAKAMWMLKKFSEGYNDMYFVDDALPNVKAVKSVLNQLDIKSDVQQALKFSRTNDVNKKVNDILEQSLGIKSKKVFTKAEAAIRGKEAKRRKLFIPDTAADLELLLEPLYGKGKEGIENKKWFEENFVRKWERGINDFNNARQTITNDYMSLRKKMKDVVKQLPKAVEGTSFTTDMAMRVYLWNKAGYEVPDLAASSKQKLIRHVVNNPKLKAYADNVAKLTKLEGGLKEPTVEWYAETIASEIQGLGEGIGRKKYIQEFIDAKNEIFTEANLNKMQSKLGENWRETIEDMFDRMETGRTRSMKIGKIGNQIMNYLNGSTGAIMNFNTRSATLQLISTVNFVNSSFNNPLRAGQAFANQPQYWKDFMFIMNSDMLKQRRQGLEINVSEAELATAAANTKNPAKSALAKILKAGYLPTKVADSFAIAAGGATYYRNAIRKYTKEGLSKAEAERKAFIDFQAIAERTQQSSRAGLLSKQQTSFEGRLILPFANTPMQMNRIMMKDVLDISKGRYKGFYGENSLTSKLSRIGYYGFAQSLIFAGLQSGAFALMTNSDDDKKVAESKLNMLNTVADSFLRGMGIQGAVLNGVRLAIQEFIKQDGKKYNADYSEVAEKLLNISPTVGSKFSKLDAAGNTYNYNKKVIQEEGLTLNGPLLEASTQVIEATTNAPLNRYYKKGNNIQNALDDSYYNWQRALSGMGWNVWGLGEGKDESRVRIKNKGKETEYTKYLTKEDLRREQVLKKRKEKNKAGKNQCGAIVKGKRCKNQVTKPKTRCHFHD